MAFLHVLFVRCARCVAFVWRGAERVEDCAGTACGGKREKEKGMYNHRGYHHAGHQSGDTETICHLMMAAEQRFQIYGPRL